MRLRSRATFEALERGTDVADIARKWAPALVEFEKARALLYE